jgi:hypothetical protein
MLNGFQQRHLLTANAVETHFLLQFTHKKDIITSTHFHPLFSMHVPHPQVYAGNSYRVKTWISTKLLCQQRHVTRSRSTACIGQHQGAATQDDNKTFCRSAI